MKKKLTRRDFVRLSATTAAGTILAACGVPTPEATKPAAPTATQPPAPTATKPVAAAPTKAAPAATPTPAPMVPKRGGQLTFGYSQKTSYSHFMHLREYAGGEWIYSKNWACSRLIGYRRGEGFIPDLAEKWALSNENKTLTFSLAKGVEWHDGTPFTTQDVEFTFKMMSMPGLGPYNKGRDLAPYVVGMADFINGNTDKIAGLRILDDYTIAFDLIKPLNFDVLLQPFLGVTMAPKHLLMDYLNRDKAKDILQSEWATTAKFVGTGPYKVVEYVPDQYIVFAPYEKYHRGKPLLDKLIYRSFADAQTMAAALEKQEIDCCRIPPTELERFKKMAHLYFRMNQDNPAVTGTPINTRRPLLSDKRNRQALLYALDREAINQTINAGAGQVIDTLYEAPPRFGISPNMKRYPYDPKKAKELLKEGGWDPNRKLQWAVQAVPADPALYDAINGYWADVGVQAEFFVYGQDDKVLMKPRWEFDFYMSGYKMGHPAFASDHQDALNPGCDYVCTGYEDPRFHELLDKSTQVLPDEELKKTVWELQELVSEAAQFLIFHRSPDVYGVNKRVHDLKAGYTTMDLYDWEIYKTWVES